MTKGLYNGKRGTTRLATLKLVFLRSRGRWPRWGFDQESRAAQWLLFLESPSSRLGWRVQLELLLFQTDLMGEEQALLDDCLRLQIRILQLVDEFEAAAEIRDNVLGGPSPMHHLIGAMVRQAQQAGADEVWTAFTRERAQQFRVEKGISEPPVDPGRDVLNSIGLPGGPEVFFLQGETYTPAMVVPKNLSQPIQGALRRIEAVEQAGLLSRLVQPSVIPAGLRFTWVYPDLLTTTLTPASVQGVPTEIS